MSRNEAWICLILLAVLHTHTHRQLAVVRMSSLMVSGKSPCADMENMLFIYIYTRFSFSISASPCFFVLCLWLVQEVPFSFFCAHPYNPPFLPWCDNYLVVMDKVEVLAVEVVRPGHRSRGDRSKDRVPVPPSISPPVILPPFLTPNNNWRSPQTKQQHLS